MGAAFASPSPVISCDVIEHPWRRLTVRTIVDLTDRQIAELDRLAKAREVSRAELVRKAVDRLLAEDTPDRDGAFGVWKRAGRREDGVAYQRRVRKDWPA